MQRVFVHIRESASLLQQQQIGSVRLCRRCSCRQAADTLQRLHSRYNRSWHTTRTPPKPEACWLASRMYPVTKHRAILCCISSAAATHVVVVLVCVQVALDFCLSQDLRLEGCQHRLVQLQAATHITSLHATHINLCVMCYDVSHALEDCCSCSC